MILEQTCCFAIVGLLFPSSLRSGEAVSLLMLSGEDTGAGDWGKCDLCRLIVATEKSKAEDTSLCRPLTGSPLTALGEFCWLLGEGGLKGEGTELGGVGGK